ncbi:MAG: hypothetical protein AAFX52_12990 [Pseudomonadota bacterium]
MSIQAGRIKALQDQALRDAQKGRPPANLSRLSYNERKAYNDAYANKRR